MTFPRLRAAVAALFCLSLPVVAGDWPTGPVHLYVGFPPGSSPDTIARLVADPLAKELAQPVVVENKPGAGGVIGVQQMLAAGDGHSIGITVNGPLTTAARLVPDLSYDVARDIRPVGLIAVSPLVLVVPADSPATDLASFVAQAGAEPEALSYGSVGKGSGAHLTAELFAKEAGVEMLHIPFASYAEVVSALLGGEIDAGFMAPSAALPQVEAGKLRILGVTAAEPFAQVPDVPVMAGQAGLPADFRAELWNGMIAPAGLAPEAVARLNTALDKALADPALADQLLTMGWKVTPGTPDDMAKRMADDSALWGAVIDRIEAK